MEEHVLLLVGLGNGELLPTQRYWLTPGRTVLGMGVSVSMYAS